MRLMHQSFVTTAPRPGGRQGIAEQMSRVFFNIYVEFDELDIPRQTWQCNVKHTNCHGFTNLLSPQCGGHSRELQIKILNHCCPREWGRGVVTDDWYIAIDLFPAFKKHKCGYQNVQACSMVSTYASTAWICFIIIICMNTLFYFWLMSRGVEVDWNLQTNIFSRAGACMEIDVVCI